MQKSAEICAFYEEKRGFSFNSCGKATDFYGLIFHELVFLGLVFLALYPCGKKSSIRSQFNQKYVKINSIFYKIVSYGEKIFFQIPKSEKNWDLEEQKSY